MQNKEGVISIRLGGTHLARLDRQCDKTYRTRVKQLQRLIDCGELFINLEQQLLVGSHGRGDEEAQGV